MKKVAVIVPVYNSEKYLARCLGNLVGQTLKEIEIILVNDASTDQSLEIMNDCLAQYPDKVKVINLTENHGAGGARNIGINESDAEYIGFADSDDIVDPTMYEKMYHKAQISNDTIIDCGYYNSKDDIAMIHTSDDLTGKLNGEKRSKLIVSGGYLWSKIFKAEFIKNDPHFNLREHAILEDADFLTYAFATAESIGNVKELLYQYTYHPGTVSESNTKDPYKYYTNILEAMKAVYAAVSNLPNYSEIQLAVEYELVQLFLYGAINCVMQAPNPAFQMQEKLVELKRLKDNMIQIPYENNEYIKAKITGDNWNFLKNL